jgi:hypothetical protein
MHIDNPTGEEYLKIFEVSCEEHEIEFDADTFRYLIREYYEKPGRMLKACHPRDLLDQIIDFSSYHRVSPKMSTEMIDRAARSYFGELM